MSDIAIQPPAHWAGVGPGGLSDLLQARSPAVYFAAKIGDAVLASPTVRALSEVFSAPITLIAPKVAFDLCFRELSPRLVDITGVPVAGPAVGPARPADGEALTSQIGAVDVFINIVSTHLPMDHFRELQRHLAPTTSIGFKNSYERYDVTVPKEAWHTCDVLFKLARLFDPSANIETYAGPVPIPPAVREHARSMRAALPSGTKVLVVHADTDWTQKRWTAARFTELLDQFLSRHDEFVVWVVGMGDEDLSTGRARDRVIPHLGLPLDLSMGLVEHADFFVGIDSCMLHAADLARVPGVGLFGPTRSVTWGFRFGPHRHIDRRRMTDITVDEVLAAMEDLVEAQSAATPERI